MKTIPRYLTSRLLDALKVSPVVFLNGARQSGKSTLVQSLADQIGLDKDHPATYVSLDRATQMDAAAAAPEAFLKNYKYALIIDEVQMVPELFRALKIVVDDLRLQDKENAHGKYLLTGSANILALPKLSDSLVGRMSVLTLFSFSSTEASKGKGNGLEKLLAMDFSNLTNRGISLIDAIKISTFPDI
ncbi:MAG: AAA family ATPase [Chitinophagaceae bacterium]